MPQMRSGAVTWGKAHLTQAFTAYLNSKATPTIAVRAYCTISIRSGRYDTYQPTQHAANGAAPINSQQ